MAKRDGKAMANANSKRMLRNGTGRYGTRESQDSRASSFVPDAANPVDNGWSLADEWFADYLRRVQQAGRKKAKALAEALPRPRDAQLRRVAVYDAQTERLLAQVREVRDVA